MATEQKYYIPWQRNPWRLTLFSITFIIVASLNIYFGTDAGKRNTGFYPMLVFGAAMIIYAWTYFEKWKIKKGFDRERYINRLPNLFFIVGDMCGYTGFIILIISKNIPPVSNTLGIILVIMGMLIMMAGYFVIGYYQMSAQNPPQRYKVPPYEIVIALVLVILAIYLKAEDWRFADAVIVITIVFLAAMIIRFIRTEMSKRQADNH